MLFFFSYCFSGCFFGRRSMRTLGGRVGRPARWDKIKRQRGSLKAWRLVDWKEVVDGAVETGRVW